MPTRSYEDIVTKSRGKWGPEAVKLSERLSAQLEAEVSAQVRLGRQIASARELAHLSQPQLAKQSGLQQADISRIERGLGNPTRDTLVKLADALGMQLVLQPNDSLHGQVA